MSSAKPTTFKPQEMDLIRTHVQEGDEVLATIHIPWPVAVADTVEAMSADRPYHFNPGIDAALETIKAGQGSLFDPAVVGACLRLFQEQRYQLRRPAP